MYLDLPFLSSLLHVGMHAESDFKHNITWQPVGTLKWIGQGRQIVLQAREKVSGIQGRQIVLQAREKVSGIQPVLWHNFICGENMHPPWQAPSSALVRRTWRRRSAAGSCPGYKSWECGPCGGSTECRHQDFSASATHPGWGRRRRK